MAAQNKTLYDTDLYQWTQETARAIAQRDLDNIVWENLQEEIEALGRSQKKASKSLTVQLLIDLLHLEYWTWRREYYVQGWETKIVTFRLQLIDTLESKTLYSYFVSEPDSFYNHAKKLAIAKYRKEGLTTPTLPAQCPYTVEQLLGEFIP